MKVLDEMRISIAMFVSILAVVGCAPADPKIRLQMTCAESFKLSLKDPDSLEIVANLGARGVLEDEGKGFWLRYKAKNSYGAFDSSNVYCSIHSDGTATRDTVHENLAVQIEEGVILEAQIRGLRAGKPNEEMNWGDTGTIAKFNVFESPDALLLMKFYKP